MLGKNNERGAVLFFVILVFLPIIIEAIQLAAMAVANTGVVMGVAAMAIMQPSVTAPRKSLVFLLHNSFLCV